MKIKRYFARDMRSALRAVQQEQGPDAVILSSHETPDGIELVAAVDYDESLIQQSRSTLARDSASRDAARIAAAPQAYNADQYRDAQNLAGIDDVVVPSTPRPSASRKPGYAAGYGSKPRATEAANNPALEQQIEAMREMLETRLDAVASSYHSSSPAKRNAHALLMAIGLRGNHATRLAEAIGNELTPAQSRQAVLRQLADDLPLGRQDLLSKGGALALVGPTGVGKTTTAAKLAARHILKFGQGSVQLVGTDEYRIGAQEQLAAYARIFGAPLHRIHSADELTDILRTRRNEELVLVDTAGIGGRDLVLHQQFDLLRPQTGMHRALCLSAATSASDLAMQAQRFAAVRPNCVVLTKLDETQQLGQALSFLLDQKLPLAYTSDGQQVPEDLHLPRAADMIAMALEQRKRAGARTVEDIRACA